MVLQTSDGTTPTNGNSSLSSQLNSNGGFVPHSIQIMNHDLTRLDRFDGDNFTWWQEKVMFFLTSLKLAYILDDALEALPEPTPNDPADVVDRRVARKADDYLCRGYILNALSDNVYAAHRTIESAKELWIALDTKYRIEESSNRKFLISNYIDFKMTNDKSLLTQVHDLQKIVGDLKT